MPSKAYSAAMSHLVHSMLRLMHKQNLTVRQELDADHIAEVACYHVTQCDDAPMVPKSHYAFVLPMELQ